MCVRFSHVVARSGSWFIFKALLYFLVWVYIIYVLCCWWTFSYCPVWGCYQWCFSEISFHVFGCWFGPRIRVCRMYVCSDRVDIARQFSKVIALSYTPIRSVWGLWLFSIFPINCFFYFSHSDGCIFISPCGLLCISPVSHEAKLLFYVFIGTFGYPLLWSTYSRHFFRKMRLSAFLLIYL